MKKTQKHRTVVKTENSRNARNSTPKGRLTLAFGTLTQSIQLVKYTLLRKQSEYSHFITRNTEINTLTPRNCIASTKY